MSRYVLTFYKKGNMRFISHLDMQRLFRRVLYRANIPLEFSQGFNPHPITNLVQPLSLGFEAEKDYFEFETKVKLNTETLLESLNQALPAGIAFTGIKEIPHEKKNLSSVTEYSSFLVFILGSTTSKEEIRDFLSQKEILVLKRDKKTKQYVEKDMKNWIYSISGPNDIEDGQIFEMVLRAAPNETLNPSQLCDSLLKFTNQSSDEVRITRTDLLFNENGTLKSLFNREI